MQDESLNSVFLFKLDTAAKQFRRYKTRQFKQHNIDITSEQWILLKNISEIPGIIQSDLANISKKEAAAVTRTLDIMEKKEWITRTSDPNNRRVHHLFITPKGEALIAEVLPIALAVRSQASKGISKEELQILNTLLDKIFNNLE